MFAVDAAVSSLEEYHIREYDKKIKEFEESIEFRNNAYYVDLSWFEDKIKAVPLNY